jgi:G:T/U-mismatch repair DNA glycosylase
MMDLYKAYLELLDALSADLEQLSQLERQKTDAVRRDDLEALNEALNREQALALAFRGMEQKRARLLKEMDLRSTSLSSLPGQYPPEMRASARRSVESLQDQYRVYRGCSEVARNTLECTLHEIEKAISSMGGSAVNGPGYATPDVELPRAMKTDFRA